MDSHEGRPGVKVRVKEGHRKAQFAGMLGTVKDCYGSPKYPALDVELEDGRYELFWAHHLEKAEIDFATQSVPFYDGS